MSQAFFLSRWSVPLLSSAIMAAFVVGLTSFPTPSRAETEASTETPSSADQKQAPYWENVADPFVEKKAGQYFEMMLGIKDPLGEEIIYSLLDSVLPNGVNLTTKGLLSGQINEAGLYEFTVLGMTSRQVGMKKKLRLLILNKDGSKPEIALSEDDVSDLPEGARKVSYNDLLNEQNVLTCNKIRQNMPDLESGDMAFPNPKDPSQMIGIWCDMDFEEGGWTYVGTKTPIGVPQQTEQIKDPTKNRNAVLAPWLWQAYLSDATELRLGDYAIIDLTQIDFNCVPLADDLKAPILAVAATGDCSGTSAEQFVIGGPFMGKGMTQLPSGIYQSKEHAHQAIKWLKQPAIQDHQKVVTGQQKLDIFVR